MRTFLDLGIKSFFPQNIKKDLKLGSFYFSIFESYFLKYKKFFKVSVSWNITKFCFLKYKEYFFRVFRFRNIRKAFLILELKSSISQNIKKQKTFSKCVRYLFFAKHSIVYVWQRSDYVSVSEYTRILNMLLDLNMRGLWIYQSSEYTLAKI